MSTILIPVRNQLRPGAAANAGGVQTPRVSAAPQPTLVYFRARADGDQMAAPGRAMERAGGAIAQLGEKFQVMHQRVEEAETQAAEVEMEDKLADELVNFQIGLNEKPVETWDDEFTKFSAGIEAKVLPAKLPGELRGRFSQKITQNLQRARLLTAGDAIKARIGETREKLLTARANALKLNDVPRAQAIVNEAAPGMFTGADRERLNREAVDTAARIAEQNKREAKAAAFNAAEASIVEAATQYPLPEVLGTLDLPGFGGGQLDAADLQRLRDRAQATARDHSMTDYAAAVDSIVTGELNSSAGIDALKSFHLGPAQRDDLKTILAKQSDAKERARLADPDTQWQIYGDLLHRVETWIKDAPTAEKDYFQIHRDAAQLPENLRGEITGPLSRKRLAKPPGPDDETKDYVRERLSTVYESGALGKWRVRVPKEKGDAGYYQGTKDTKDAIDRGVQAQAQRTIAKTAQSLRRWLEKNPNATIDEVDAELARILTTRGDAEEVKRLLNRTPWTVPSHNPGLEPHLPMPEIPGPPDYRSLLPDFAPETR